LRTLNYQNEKEDYLWFFNFFANKIYFVRKINTESILLMTDEKMNKVYIVKIDTANNKRNVKVVNESDLSVDSLSISDINYFVSENKLIIFLFDEFSNSLFNLKFDLTRMEKEIINNVYVSLDSLDFIHHKMNCYQMKELNYDCVFLGTNRLSILNI